MRRINQELPTIAVLIALVFPRSAHAAPVDGRFQYQLQTSVLDLSQTVLDDVEASDEYGTTVGGGSTFSAKYGLSGRVGAGLGYGLSERFYIHFLFGFESESSTTSLQGDEFDSSYTEVELMLSARYVSGPPERNARLFFGGGLGLKGDGGETQGDPASKVVGDALSLAALLGVHGFLHDNLSIDPTLELSVSRARVVYSGVESAGIGFRAMLVLGMTGWFRGPPSATRSAGGSAP